VLATGDKKGLHHEMVNGIKVYRGGIKNIYWTYGNREHSRIKKLLWHIKDMYNAGMKDYVREVIALEKPDIVSCHNIAGWSVAVWDEINRAKIPTVQVLHDFYFLCTKSTLFKNDSRCDKRCFECKLMRILHRQKSKNINAVVGVCRDVVDRVVNAGYFTNSLKTAIHNVRIIPDTGKKHQQTETDNPVFGFIGSLIPSKGILWLIEQFQKVNSKNISLKIAGKGESNYENQLKNISKNDTRISFLGYTKSEDFYPSVDVLVIPSIWHEPLASVAIEACARHIPVITSATGGLKEIIIDGYNGLHCDISSPDSLSDAISKIIADKDLLNELRKNARESVRSFLDTDRLTSEYEDVYKKVIKRDFIK
ncbi:MAG: glycosyltransferase family 4 protein, partial [Bacteroidales bacterium]|nr:glycosyltransferase family 4 protein [Bacteroidales bacterium]